MSRASVLVYCDDPRHREKVTLYEFREDLTDGWTEFYTSRATQGYRQATVVLVNDEPVEFARVRSDEPSPAESIRSGSPAVRRTYRLECRKCGAAGHQDVSEARWWSVLDLIRDAGSVECSLRGVGAILQALGEGRRLP